MRKDVVKISAAVVALLTGLAACGSGSSGTDGKSPAKVTIGLYAELSGANAYYGQFFLTGAQLAADDINAKGGIGGKTKIEIRAEDTGGVEAQTVSAFQLLRSKYKANYVIGYGSGATLAVAPIANKQKVVIMNPGASDAKLGKAGKFVFSCIPFLNNEIPPMAEYMVKKRSLSKLAILTTDDTIGTAAGDMIEKEVATAGGEVVGRQTAPAQATTFESQIAKLKGSGADVLFLGGLNNKVNLMINQVRQAGWDVQISAGSLVAGDPTISKNKNAEGLIHPLYPFDPGQAFLDRYKKRFKKDAPPSAYLGNYYDAVQIYAHAYEYAVEHDLGTDGSGLQKAIEKLGPITSVYGGKVTPSNTGEVRRATAIAELTNGADKIVVTIPAE